MTEKKISGRKENLFCRGQIEYLATQLFTLRPENENL